MASLPEPRGLRRSSSSSSDSCGPTADRDGSLGYNASPSSPTLLDETPGTPPSCHFTSDSRYSSIDPDSSQSCGASVHACRPGMLARLYFNSHAVGMCKEERAVRRSILQDQDKLFMDLVAWERRHRPPCGHFKQIKGVLHRIDMRVTRGGEGPDARRPARRILRSRSEECARVAPSATDGDGCVPDGRHRPMSSVFRKAHRRAHQC